MPKLVDDWFTYLDEAGRDWLARQIGCDLGALPLYATSVIKAYEAEGLRPDDFLNRSKCQCGICRNFRILLENNKLLF